MNSWLFYKKYFSSINFSLQSNKLFCFWVLSFYWSAVPVVVHWKAGLKETGRPCKIRAQELGKFPILWFRTLSFPSYIAECTLFASVYISVLPPMTVLRLLAFGFPLKNDFCGNVVWFAKYCICSIPGFC